MFNGNVYVHVKAYGNVLSCINIYIYMLKCYESFKMCEECICVLMIKERI